MPPKGPYERILEIIRIILTNKRELNERIIKPRPLRLCHNWQNLAYCLFLSFRTRSGIHLFQGVTLLDAGRRSRFTGKGDIGVSA